MAVYQRKDIAEGIGYTSIIDPKFKTQRVQIMFITELKRKLLRKMPLLSAF